MLGSIKSWLKSRSKFQLLKILSFPAILVCVAGIWFASQRSLEKKLDAIRTQGLPTSMDDLNSYYSIPEGVVDSTELWLAVYKALEVADIRTKGKYLLFVGHGDAPAFDEKWAGFEASKELIGDLNVELELVYKAAEAGGQRRYPVDFSSVDFNIGIMLQTLAGVDRLLSLAAHVHIREGNCDAAFKDVKAIFSLANALQGEVSMAPASMKTAIRYTGTTLLEEVLPECQWSNEQLLELQQIVLQANLRKEMVRALNGERALVLASIEQFRITALKNPNKHSALDYFEKTLASISGTWSELLKNQRLIDLQLAKQTAGTISSMKKFGTRLMLISSEQFIIANMRAVAMQRCLNAALAARRFQLEHGELPQSLDEIPHELLTTGKFSEDLLTDPFDEKPLRYQIDSEDGSRLLIYSIGRNRQDDGGDCPRGDQANPLDIGFWLNIRD